MPANAFDLLEEDALHRPARPGDVKRRAWLEPEIGVWKGGGKKRREILGPVSFEGSFTGRTRGFVRVHALLGRSDLKVDAIRRLGPHGGRKSTAIGL